MAGRDISAVELEGYSSWLIEGLRGGRSLDPTWKAGGATGRASLRFCPCRKLPCCHSDFLTQPCLVLSLRICIPVCPRWLGPEVWPSPPPTVPWPGLHIVKPEIACAESKQLKN